MSFLWWFKRCVGRGKDHCLGDGFVRVVCVFVVGPPLPPQNAKSLFCFFLGKKKNNGAFFPHTPPHPPPQNEKKKKHPCLVLLLWGFGVVFLVVASPTPPILQSVPGGTRPPGVWERRASPSSLLVPTPINGQLTGGDQWTVGQVSGVGGLAGRKGVDVEGGGVKLLLSMWAHHRCKDQLAGSQILNQRNPPIRTTPPGPPPLVHSAGGGQVCWLVLFVQVRGVGFWYVLGSVVDKVRESVGLCGAQNQRGVFGVGRVEKG